MADGASLPGYAAARNPAHDVKLALCASQGQGLADNILQGFQAEIVVNVTIVNGDLACALIYADSGYRAFPSASAVEIGYVLLSHIPGVGLLGGVLVLASGIGPQPAHSVAPNGVGGDHALHSKLHSHLGLCLHQSVIAHRL